MNMNRLINMGVRMLMNKGIELAASRGKKPEEMTPQEREAAQKTRATGQKAQRGLGMIRRLMR